MLRKYLRRRWSSDHFTLDLCQSHKKMYKFLCAPTHSSCNVRIDNLPTNLRRKSFVLLLTVDAIDLTKSWSRTTLLSVVISTIGEISNVLLCDYRLSAVERIRENSKTDRFDRTSTEIC
jgi:hypothetical protein